MRNKVLFGFCLLLFSTATARSQSFVEVQEGTWPLILSAPHGGYLAPDSLVDRSCSACVTIRDLRTQEWARALADAIETRTGERPWLVINLLDRVKLDPNRTMEEAADGDPHAEAAWIIYHTALENASASIAQDHGGGLLLDLHGHGHDELRFELGYLLSAARLRESDPTFSELSTQSSIRKLVERSGQTLSVLVRGGDSFGQFLERSGIPSTPSERDPAPLSGQPFFSGGYITARHGSRDGGVLDAIQLEAHREGARDSEVNVETLAQNVADATIAFMQRWYPEVLNTSVESAIDVPQECLLQQGDWLQMSAGCQAGVVELFDILGRRVASFRLNEGQRVPLPDLSRGVYLARKERSKTSVIIYR
ncbi:MAG: T9SS type A sorting domain-containing protein [Bacteroidetes bacterium]|nr:T9SS type A sorting domain-containing protein [Bacteroidota bacterium]